MIIDGHDTDSRVFVVAEVGNNHEGDERLAIDLIGEAARAGADAVKFQTIIKDSLTTALNSERIAQLEKFTLPVSAFGRLRDVAKAEGVTFLSTPFDLESVRNLDPLVPAFKIASGDNTFYPLIDAVLETGKPMILSTGLLDAEGIRAVGRYVRNGWTTRGIHQELAMLHCVVSYPTASQEANLRCIPSLSEAADVIGYSDHTLGINAAVLSIAVGARIIEKHFTISKSHSSFRDHQLSADPADLAEMVRRIREAELCLGAQTTVPTEAERSVESNVRRSIVASRDLPKGLVLKLSDVTWVRPGGGMPPGQEDQLLGRSLRRDVDHGEMIRQEDVE